MGDIPGVPGLFVAGVFSGALSTVSSGLNSLAAVCLKDFIASGFNIALSDEKQTILTKVLAVVFGVVGYLAVFMVKYLPGVLEAAFLIFGIVGGPVLGAFTLGMFFPFATSVVSKCIPMFLAPSGALEMLIFVRLSVCSMKVCLELSIFILE